MGDTVILIDSCSDLPIEYIEKNNIPTIGLTVNFKGEQIVDDFGKTLTYKDFYNAVREGEMPTTSQINSYTYKDIFEKYIKEKKSIIYLGFSSQLSGSLNSSHIARNELLEEYKEADITIIDTKSASLGEGLIVYYANEMLKKGCTKDEIVNWVEENISKVNHWFTVDDLNHLKRGGRISSTGAMIGTMLNIKPILTIDGEGKLVPASKVKGRKKALMSLVDEFRQKSVNPEEQVIFISHGDSLKDALIVKDMITSEFNVKDVIINNVGPVIGSHAGPGTIALFFIGEKR
jgi:DegV family protein with EDD domain